MDNTLIKDAVDDIIGQNPDVLISGINGHQERDIREMNPLEQKTTERAEDVTTEDIKAKNTTIIEPKVSNFTNSKTFQNNIVNLSWKPRCSACG